MRILSILDLNQCQKEISADELRIAADNFSKLNRRDIIVSLTTGSQRLIVLTNCLIQLFQVLRIRPQILNKVSSIVSCRSEIGADDPFTQGGNRLPCLIIYQSEKISGLDIILIKLQADTKLINRAGKVTDLGHIKSLVVIASRQLLCYILAENHS